jgi:hypothetical protein
MKSIFSILFIAFSLYSFAQEDVLKIEARRNLQNIAFCQCVNKLSSEKSLSVASDNSSQGFAEKSRHNFDAILEILEFTDQYVLNIIEQGRYQSKKGSNLILMPCLDYYNSDLLLKKIISLDDQID